MFTFCFALPHCFYEQTSHYELLKLSNHVLLCYVFKLITYFLRVVSNNLNINTHSINRCSLCYWSAQKNIILLTFVIFVFLLSLDCCLYPKRKMTPVDEKLFEREPDRDWCSVRMQAPLIGICFLYASHPLSPDVCVHLRMQDGTHSHKHPHIHITMRLTSEKFGDSATSAYWQLYGFIWWWVYLHLSHLKGEKIGGGVCVDGYTM